ncbi:outer membrane protein OmpK [Aliagarivorans taiwanensis]|uniref:outer membrane protein OmpK n=1 Tax=Aliagarivorans taiwanensis TaxID=561966 RepID=UPI0003F5ED43|nr:outer membrane protein OmpK [Aliagarivorans taiwanensis]
MLKKLSIAAVAAVGVSGAANAEYLYGFGGMYVDHQSWDHGLNEVNNPKGRNQYVIGIEGGAGFTWGELYGFYDYENIGNAPDQRAAAAKATAHVYLGDTGASIYAQVYDFGSDMQSEQNRVLGLGYTKLGGDNWFFKPWIGIHQITANDGFADEATAKVNGNNGYMAGWTGRYAWNMFGQNFSVVNWNEIEFDRSEEITANQGGKNGWNGGAMLSWHITDNLYTGVTYRYFRNKLGHEGYGDLFIYRIGYNF